MSTGSINSDAVRPWYRPHRGSVVVALIAAAFVVMMNASRFAPADWHSKRGWPLTFFHRHAEAHYHSSSFASRSIDRPRGAHFSALTFVADIAVGAAIAIGLLALAERRIRRQGRLTQISLREMMLLVTLLCIVIGKELSTLRRQRDGIEQLFGSNCSYHVEEGLPYWLRRLSLERFELTSFTRARFAPLDRVVSMDLHGPRCGGDRLRPLATFTGLTSLALLSESVDDDSMRHVGPLARLTSLSIAGSRVTDSGLEHLTGLNQLRCFELRSTHITGAGLQCLSSLKQIESLDVSDTFIDDDSLARLGDLPNLQNLCLSSTPIGDRGLRRLAACRQLRLLELAGTRITNQGLLALAALRQLEELDVRDTCASKAGVARLRVVLPRCTILSGNR